MPHLRLRSAFLYTHDVETDFLEAGLALGYVLLGDGPDDLLLTRGHRLHRLAKARPPAQLDLQENQTIAVA